MARAGETDAQNASNQYSQYATSALNNYNSQAAQTSDAISALQGQGNPYQSKAFLTNQNIQTSAAMNSTNNAAKQQLNDAALRTGTNTAAMGRTIASNARAGQRTMDNYNATQSNENEGKYLQLEQGLIGDRQNLANSEAGVYSTSASNETAANGQVINANGQDEQMWGNIISGAAGAAGSAFSGKA